MSASVGKMQILKLYKTMLRESDKFASYNFKNYAIRRIKDGFKGNKTMTDPKKIQEELAYAQENLRMLRRQSVIGDMFRSEKLVIENRRERSSVYPSFGTTKVEAERIKESAEIKTKLKPVVRRGGMKEKD